MNDSSALPQPDAERSGIVQGIRQSSSSAPQPANSLVAGPEHNESKAGTDRRRKRRALISAPVRVRAVDITSGGPDEISTTVDVSRNGILFLTDDQSFHRGTEVAVTFPYTSAPGVPQSEQPGSIVRVTAREDGRLAVAIAFGVMGSGEHIVNAAGVRLDTQTSPIVGEAQIEISESDECSKKPLVLAVDSDAAARDSLKAYLSGEGYKVIAVATASDARDVLNMMTPALLIAEIEGEGLPGFDLCAHVKGTPRLKHIPVMLTTGSAYPSDYSNAHSLGAIVCMAKPYRQERLGHVVRLLVAPGGTRADAQPPHTPDPSRRPKRPASFRMSTSKSIRFR